MRKNAAIPYAIIAVLGILTVIIVAFVGVNQRADIQQAEEGGGEQTEQPADNGGESGGGDTADVSGEEVFANNCAACHGADLSGGAGPALATVGADYSAEEIAEIVQNGIGAMPAQTQVQGAELDALTQWLAEQQ